MGDWVELRVHGVHGTSPANMLGVADSDVRQIAGDALTGVYRAEDVELPLRTLRSGPDQPENVAVEAYSWGALTSGVQGMLGWVRRVGWLLLLPFALANMAYWARMHVAVGDRRDRWGVRAVRASGLLLTVFMILTPVVIAVDMIGWQCFREGVPRCSRLPGQLDFLAGWTAGQRLLVASLVPLLVVLLLWILSSQTMNSYEVGRPPEHEKGDDKDVDKGDDKNRTQLPGLILRRDALWRSKDRTGQLRNLHVAAALLALVIVISTHMVRARTHGHDVPPFWLAMLVVASAVLLVCLVVVCLPQVGDIGPHDDAPGPPAWWSARLRDVAALLVVVQSVALWKHGGALDQTLSFQGTDWWILSLFVALTALHLSVFFGARMRAVVAVPLVLGVAAGGIVMVVLYAHHQYLRFSRDRLGLAVLIAVLGFGLMVFWHYRIADPEPLPGAPRQPHTRDRVAWRGAGASVLLAAAAWVGLLFTSSAVTAAADYLNGPQSVGDLRTLTHETEPGTPQYFGATGKVVLRKPVITIEGDLIVVNAGNVIADRILAHVDGDQIDHLIGTRKFRGPIRLHLPAGSVLDIDRGCEVTRYVPGHGCIRNLTARWFATEQIPVGDREVWLGSLVGCSDPAASTRTYQTVSTGLCPARKQGLVVLRPQERLQAPLVVPQVLAWMPIGQFVWLIAVALAALGCLVRFNTGAGKAVTASLSASKIKPPDDAIPLVDRVRCIAKRRGAALSHRAETLLDVIGSVTGLVALLLIVCSLTGQVPWDRGGMAWTNPLATVSLYLMLGTAGGLILLGSYLRRSASTRKAVGVIWDLCTFWPRAAHPLAPPCYAERVVPELETRARWVLRSDGGSNQLILSGHSQGSLILAATASRLDDEDFDRVRFITYGSQIRALYGRVFPRVFGPEAIGYVPTPRSPRLGNGWPDTGVKPGHGGDAVPGSLRYRIEHRDDGRPGGSWVNLFRRSDPLGFRVFADLDGDPLAPSSGSDLPVMEVPTADRGDPGPAVAGHSDYQHTEVYRRVVCSWTGEEEFEATYDPGGVLDLPPKPQG
ncbi:hypothetical protein [Nocardioides marmorisolisilvae]|uniref:Integral membrane protein n=1 Tax=Nocardioides marmorisolisilvae TaxID=1542737 RepID=A0A3N0E0B6_9ACTN|nr:hypothetical protein [Nocardioides marmorisolisilvae]RNL81240.1 hypothetical protein EFL95_02410 [Nocardioides marmorisolisilvae]